MNAHPSSTAPWLRTCGLALLAIAVAVPAPAAAQGQACVLKGPLVITSKPKGQGRKIHLTSGTSLEILGRQQSWLQVRVNGQEGYGQVSQVRHICAPHTKAGSDALAELPLEALPLPALAALPDAPAEPAKPAATKPAEPTKAPEPTKPAEQPPKVAAAKPAPEAPAAVVSKPTEATKPAPAADAATPPNAPAATAQTSPAASPSPPMAFYPPPEGTSVRTDPATSVAEQLTPPRRWGALRASLWTAAGVTLVGGGVWYIYNNNANFDKYDKQIKDFNARALAGDPSATAAQRAALEKDRDGWNRDKYISLGIASLGAALAITAGVLTIIGDDPGSGTDSDVNAPPADPLHRLTLTPFGIAGTF